jgi:hypothetical protein
MSVRAWRDSRIRFGGTNSDEQPRVAFGLLLIPVKNQRLVLGIATHAEVLIASDLRQDRMTVANTLP